MQSKCPEILLNYEDLIKLKAIILFQKFIHLVVPRRGNTSVLSSLPSARRWATAPEETQRASGSRAPPGWRAEASLSLLCGLLVAADSDALPHGFEADPVHSLRGGCDGHLCLKSVSAQITASPTGTLMRELYNEQAVYQSGSSQRTGNSRALQGCCPQVGLLFPQEKPQYCFYVSSVYWKHPPPRLSRVIS